jgi:putative membrane protein
MAQYYLWAKALHIIAVIAWMAGMLYLPRLYVYHAGLKAGSEASELLKVMERRLLRFIINPAMVLVYVFGGWLVWITRAWEPGNGKWFHVKFALVLVLTTIHGLLAKYRKDFACDANTRTAKYYRILNEAVTLLMMAIVLLAVVKPF